MMEFLPSRIQPEIRFLHYSYNRWYSSNHHVRSSQGHHWWLISDVTVHWTLDSVQPQWRHGPTSQPLKWRWPDIHLLTQRKSIPCFKMLSQLGCCHHRSHRHHHPISRHYHHCHHLLFITLCFPRRFSWVVSVPAAQRGMDGWRLEAGVKSLESALERRPCRTSYWLSLVHVGLSLPPENSTYIY